MPFLENTVPVSEDFPHSNDCNDSNDDYFHFSLSLSHLPVDILYYMISLENDGELPIDRVYLFEAS